MSVNYTNLVNWACCKQNENILKECIDMKYNLNEEFIFPFFSSLMVAVKTTNNLNIIKLLVNNGADLNHLNYSGHCVLLSHDLNHEYSSFLQSIGIESLKNDKKGMSTLAIEISKNNPWLASATKNEVNQVDACGLTPFMWAIFFERQNYIDYYLKLGADVNKAGKTGVTPLMMATFQGNLDIVKQLVATGADINQLDNNGLSAISYFANTDVIDYLIDNGAKIDPCNNNFCKSPLMLAAIQNDETYFDYFLNKNANVNLIDTDGNSILSYAILNKNIKNAEKLLAKGANINACGPKGKPPLAWSVFLNNPQITQFLLDNKANINCTDHQERTALYYAKKYKYVKIVKLLKDYGATTTNKDIFSAIRTKDIELIKTLLDHLTIYHKNEKNQTAFDVAVQLGDLDIINLLLKKENKSLVHSALPTAIQNKNIQLVKLLLGKGADVNRIYKKTKQSPLMQAINQRSADIVELLLKFNANVKTNEHPSPFKRALEMGQGNVIKMLIERTVDLNELDKGKSYLDLAIDDNNMNVIMFLLERGADPRNYLQRLQELAADSDDLDILLDNVLKYLNRSNKTESD